MLVRLGAPKHVPLSVLANWAEENRIPVVYREVVTFYEAARWGKGKGKLTSNKRYGLIFSRRSIKQIKVNPIVRLTFDQRFHVLTRPQDELLLVVRFGLERVDAP